MSSRGTYAKNGHATTEEFETVGNILDAKILKGKGNRHNLPDYSVTPNRIYIKVDSNNQFRELRVYDENCKVELEIAYHHEKALNPDLSKSVVHYHLYDEELKRTSAALLTPEIRQKYDKYLKEFGL